MIRPAQYYVVAIVGRAPTFRSLVIKYHPAKLAWPAGLFVRPVDILARKRTCFLFAQSASQADDTSPESHGTVSYLAIARMLCILRFAD